MDQFIHRPTVVWKFKEDAEFTVPYEFITYALLEKAKEDGLIENKENISIKSLELDESDRLIHIKTEIFMLAEN